MSPQERQDLKLLFVATALYYGHELHNEALELYVADLEDLDFAEVSRALGELRRDPKTRRCPLPADVRARVAPPVDTDAWGVRVANEIIEAIGRVGPYQLPELSDVAAEVVRLEGGWARVCEVTTNDNMSIYKAQWRELAKAVAAGERSRPDRVSLPESGGLKALGVTLPSMPEDTP